MSVRWLLPFQTNSIIITHTEKRKQVFFIIRTKGCFVEGTPFKSVVSGLMNKYDKSVERLRNTNRVHLADMFYAKTLFLSYFLCVWKMFRKIVLLLCKLRKKNYYCRLTKCEMKRLFPYCFDDVFMIAHYYENLAKKCKIIFFAHERRRKNKLEFFPFFAEMPKL